MKVLVAGGSGFIGRNIIKKFKEENYETISYDIDHSNSNADVNINGSIMDYDELYKASKDVDVIYNMAAVTSPPQFEDFNSDGYKINIMGTYNVMLSAFNNNVKKVILASSSALYGNIDFPGKESLEIKDYINLYPVTKMANEITGKVFSNNSDVKVSFMRFFNVYGNGENSKGAYSSIISKFIDDFKNNRSPVIYGDGKQRRDFVYIKDVAGACYLAYKYGKPGEAYNVGTGKSVTFNEIYNIVKEEMDKDINAKYVKNPLKSYQYFTQADIAKSLNEIKFKAKYDIRSGVRDMLDNSN